MADQVQVKLRKRLEALLKLPENQVCADCRKRGPRWASANLGIFMCIECSGIHRNLGVHISFVRSVNLDSWTAKQVEFMEEWGNGRANAYYEANVPAHVQKPKDGDSVRTVEKYIRDKYEHKRFIAKTVPPKVEREVEEEVAPVETVVRRTSVAKPLKRPEVQHAVTPVAVKQVVQSPAQSVDLLNFMDEPVSTPSVASPGFGFDQPVAASQQQQQQQHFAPQGQQQFSAFDEPRRAQAHQSNVASSQDDFLNFATAPTQVSPQQQFSFPTAAPPVPVKPQASADSILSLYSTGGGSHHQMGGNGMMQQHHQQQFGGMPYGGNNFPPQQQHQHMQQQPMHGGFGGGGMMHQGGGGSMMHGGGQPQFQQHHQQPFQQQHQQPQQQQQQFGGYNNMQGGMQQQQQAPMNPFLGIPVGGGMSNNNTNQFAQQNRMMPTNIPPPVPPVNPFQSLQSFGPPAQQQQNFQQSTNVWR